MKKMLINQGSSETDFRFIADGDVSERYFCKMYHLENWYGGPYYWYIKTGGFGVPLEFMFDGTGRLGGITVVVAGNLVLEAVSPFEMPHLRKSANLPCVDLALWTDEGAEAHHEITKMRAWWQANDLWVVRAESLPTSVFDTACGLRLLFDAGNQFVGAVVLALSNEEKTMAEKAART